MKKLISLILMTLMIISCLPVSAVEPGVTDLSQTNILGFTYPYAANTYTDSVYTYDFSKMPSIKAYKDDAEAEISVATGNVEYGVENINAKEYATGDLLNDKLSDGLYFTRSEYEMAKVTGTTETAVEGGDNKNLAPADNTYKMVRLTEDTGVDFVWEEEQTIARLHLWVWPANRINKYDIYYQSYSSTTEKWSWKKLQSGSFKYFDNMAKSETNSTFCAVVLDRSVSTIGLRFVVRDLIEVENEEKAVYITEAVPRSTNDINLISVNPRQTANTVSATTGKGANVSQAIYTEDSAVGYYNTSSAANAVFVDGKNANYQYAFPVGDTLALGTVKGPGNYGWRAFTEKKTVDAGLGDGSTKEITVNYDPFFAVDFGEAKHRINKIKVGAHNANDGITGVKLMCTNDPDVYKALSNAESNVDDGWTMVGEWTGTIKKNGSEEKTVAYAPEARYWKIVITIDNSTGTSYGRILYYPGMYSISDYETSNSVSAVGGFIDGNEAYRLNDNYRMTYAEYRQNKFGSYKKPSALTKYFAKFDAADTGIEWSFDEAKDIKRFDFWVWPKNAINTYEIQSFNAETKKWETKYGDGDWNPGTPEAALGATDTSSDNTYCYSVVLPNTLTTNKVRFVIKSFTDSSYGAYIAEANVGTTNEINLLARNPENNDGQTHSIYVTGSRYTNNEESTDGTSANHTGYRSVGGTTYGFWNEAGENAWYMVQLSGRHKINRIAGFNVDMSAAKKMEVWCSDDSADFAALNSDPALLSKADSEHSWKKVATIDGEYSGNKLVFDIPNAPTAELWLIRCTEQGKGTLRFDAPPEFYELAENELSTDEFQGTLEARKAVTLVLDNYDKLAEATGTSDVYLALYSGEDDNQKLISVTPVTDVAFDDAQNMVVYKVPAGAEGTLTLRAFIWDGSESLKPLANDISYSEAVN